MKILFNYISILLLASVIFSCSGSNSDGLNNNYDYQNECEVVNLTIEVLDEIDEKYNIEKSGGSYFVDLNKISEEETQVLINLCYITQCLKDRRGISFEWNYGDFKNCPNVNKMMDRMDAMDDILRNYDRNWNSGRIKDFNIIFPTFPNNLKERFGIK